MDARRKRNESEKKKFAGSKLFRTGKAAIRADLANFSKFLRIN